MILQRRQKYTTEDLRRIPGAGLSLISRVSAVKTRRKGRFAAEWWAWPNNLHFLSLASLSMIGGFVADQTSWGIWLLVTCLITPSVQPYHECSHDAAICSQGAVSLHINHAQQHLQISLWGWSTSPLLSFEPPLLDIWKAIPTFANIMFFFLTF